MPHLSGVSKRPSLVNFPIPFDHPYTVPTLLLTVSVSACLYYYLQASHASDLIEAVRLRDVSKRRHLKRHQDRYASLKVERQYVNPFTEWKQVTWWETALHWLRRCKNKNDLSACGSEEHDLPSVQKPAFENSSGRRQSTCLITIEGLTILTDPVFGDRTVDRFYGYPRLRPLPCSLEEIRSKLDVILISHDHFDHLDEQVVKQLGDTVTWYIPLGLAGWFRKRGVENVVELDWWQEIHHKERPEIAFACVPAMHESGLRTFFDRNRALCGDTGFVPELFQAIGKAYAPFILAAIPIGNSTSDEAIKHMHMTPAEAVQAHHLLGRPHLSIGIHWGTFLTCTRNEHRNTARELATAAQNDEHSRFITTDLGETVTLD
ncbi:beta-lactamase superfamily domain-containing protein [Radiomyces spectabilis]|uniref:beta-lactamase superfamily domain-containing protein n=1 Tax=Radiomyces spectabilis TaxID=64574 RepID=UPI002220A2EB|nr:beta-lactamase superfamily domain-containing protein [Radiomyces spectabilis]KAI8379234.1 beta-lactamase superfamily domain-containing protein [Radiomyces spectabilis]